MPDRYDVVIYEAETGLIDRIVAKYLLYDSGFRNAVGSQSFWRERVADRMDVAIVLAGSVGVGGYLTEALQH
jgi:hypothetical protein